MNIMNIPEVILEVNIPIRGVSHGLTKSQSFQELLDSQFFFERLVILVLYTVLSVPTCCVSIILYQTHVANIQS